MNVSDFRFHDSRRTVAKWMRRKGADVHAGGFIPGRGPISIVVLIAIEGVFTSLPLNSGPGRQNVESL